MNIFDFARNTSKFTSLYLFNVNVVIIEWDLITNGNEDRWSHAVSWS